MTINSGLGRSNKISCNVRMFFIHNDSSNIGLKSNSSLAFVLHCYNVD